MPSSGTFYVWASLLSERAVNNFVTGMVRRGFEVGPLARSDELTQVSEVSSLCAVKAEADHIPEPLPTDQNAPQWVLAQMVSVLEATKEQWFSLVVSHVGGTCTWRGPNITLPKDPKPKTPEPVGEDKPISALDKVDEALQ